MGPVTSLFFIYKATLCTFISKVRHFFVRENTIDYKKYKSSRCANFIIITTTTSNGLLSHIKEFTFCFCHILNLQRKTLRYLFSVCKNTTDFKKIPIQQACQLYYSNNKKLNGFLLHIKQFTSPIMLVLPFTVHFRTPITTTVTNFCVATFLNRTNL